MDKTNLPLSRRTQPELNRQRIRCRLVRRTRGQGEVGLLGERRPPVEEGTRTILSTHVEFWATLRHILKPKIVSNRPSWAKAREGLVFLCGLMSSMNAGGYTKNAIWLSNSPICACLEMEFMLP